jgi:predicted aconitase
MDAYVTLGCRPTWTCAPYQLPERPALGAHVAWAESNAIVFANSVLGARTDRYGDFVDIAAAITGRAPAAGLHLDRHRGASLVFRLAGVPEPLLRTTAGGAALGHLVGRRSGTQVPAIVGLPADTDEDVLKALGATAASSGSVALFHAVGRTPEAPTLEAVLAPGAGEATIGPDDLRAARDELTSASADTELGAVSLGTPHASLDELRRLAGLLTDRVRIPVYVNTGRATWEEARRRGLAPTIEDAGVTVVTDTCTYVTPILHGVEGAVMTDSGKWAWYAPGNLGVDVVFGTLEDCVRSALSGVVDRDEELWG